MCLTCRMLAGERKPPGGVIVRTDKVVLHHCLDVLVPGYLVASPIRHVSSIIGLTDEEYGELTHLVRSAAGIIESISEVEKVYIASIGEETTHVHFHLFPRYSWMKDDASQAMWLNGKLDGLRLMAYMRQRYRVGEEEMMTTEIVEVVNRIRSKLIQGKVDVEG